MRNLLALCLLATALMAATCKTNQQLPAQVFGQTWLHSFEEDSADVRIYRSNTFDFPPSRGRTGFTLKEDGTFIRYGIAPTDGLEEQPGTWKATGKNRVKAQLEGRQEPAQEMELLTVEPGKLRVRQLRTTGQD